MRTYYDQEGNKVATSKGCTGNMVGCLAWLVVICFVLGVIATVFGIKS